MKNKELEVAIKCLKEMQVKYVEKAKKLLYVAFAL